MDLALLFHSQEVRHRCQVRWPGVQSAFQFIPEVSSGVEVRSWVTKFFQINLAMSSWLCIVYRSDLMLEQIWSLNSSFSKGKSTAYKDVYKTSMCSLLCGDGIFMGLMVHILLAECCMWKEWFFSKVSHHEFCTFSYSIPTL